MECPSCGLNWQSNCQDCPLCGFSFSDLPSPERGLKKPLQKNGRFQGGDAIQIYRNRMARVKPENTPEVEKAYYIANVLGLLVGIGVTILLLALALPNIMSFSNPFTFIIRLIILSTVFPLICVRFLTLRYYRRKGYRI